MDNETWLYIAIAAVAIILLLALFGWMAARKRRSDRLRSQFGPEYDRTVQDTGDRKRAEAELENRRNRVGELELHSLSQTERDEFSRDWESVQKVFVDDPRGAVLQADLLVHQVMVKRGYPLDNFDREAENVSVSHPEVVDDYRTAHAVALERDRASTESLRDAFVRYRSLFSELMRA